MWTLSVINWPNVYNPCYPSVYPGDVDAQCDKLATVCDPCYPSVYPGDVDAQCDKLATVYDPRYPSVYPPGVRCRVTLRPRAADPRERVQLVFIDFSLHYPAQPGLHYPAGPAFTTPPSLHYPAGDPRDPHEFVALSLFICCCLTPALKPVT